MKITCGLQVWWISTSHAAINALLDWQDLSPWGITAEQMVLLVARHAAHSVLLVYMYCGVHRVIQRSIARPAPCVAVLQRSWATVLAGTTSG